MNGTISNFYALDPKGGQSPSSMVILLHGLGSNGQDLMSFAPLWAKHLPSTVFISPDAPFACDMMPPGYPNSFQWFSLQSRDPDFMREGIEVAAPLLSEFIETQSQRYSVAPDKIMLCGFSQGTMMSLYTAPRYSEKLAGVLGYSGALLGGEDLGAANIHKIPICLIHGEADDVVPVTAYHDAHNKLSEYGFEVSGHTTPYLTHSIDQKGLDVGLEFIRKTIAA